MRTLILLITAALALLLAACGTATDPDIAPGADHAATGDNDADTGDGDADTGDGDMTHDSTGHDDLVQVARADLARRLGVDADAIELVTVRDVTWPDGSFGCPEPGQMYTQALVEGAYIELVHDDDTYAYHWGQRLPEPFLCERSDGPPGGARY